VLGSVRAEAANPAEIEKLLGRSNPSSSAFPARSSRPPRMRSGSQEQRRAVGRGQGEGRQADHDVGQLGDAQTKLTQKLEELETRGRDIEQKIADTLRQGTREQARRPARSSPTMTISRQYVGARAPRVTS
jgi:hypothetical protein